MSDEKISIHGEKDNNLRDFFAAAALTGVLANIGYAEKPEITAESAYEWADAMLKERNKK